MHNQNMSDDKAKNLKESLKELAVYNKSFFMLIVIAILLSFMKSILSIIGPDKLKDITNIITDGLVRGINLDEIKAIGIYLICIYVASFAFDFIQGLIMASVTNRFSKKLRTEINLKINRLPLSFFDKTTVGDVLSRVTNDVDTIGQTMNQSVGTLVGALTMFLGSLFMMYKTNWIMATTAVSSILFGFFLMVMILKKTQKYFVMVQNQFGSLNEHIEEVYSGHSVVKVYNGKKEVNKKFDMINDKLYDSSLKSQFYSGLMNPIMGFISNFGYVAVCIVGAILAINGHISFGVIVAFMMYVRLFMNPIAQMSQCMTQLQSTAAASERVFAFLKNEEMTDQSEIKEQIEAKTVKGNIEFKEVKFGYNKDKLIIKNFSAKIKSGQKIAIVGPTGAGKTTIVNLLMKFYEINDGDILIDGVSTKDLTREDTHRLFTMVLQDTWLFEGTIKENIRYNQKDVTDEEIKNACKVVGLHHFIKTLPEGYDTVLNDEESLSAGQKQLLTIARAMIGYAPLLILDEATSSVDTRTEILVQQAMDKLTSGRTSFIIAHRLSTIKNADLILVMNEGNIVEQGTHDKLLAKNGFYAELYNSQFQNTNEEA